MKDPRKFLILLALLLACALRGAVTRAEGTSMMGVALDDEESLVHFALSHNLDLRAGRWDEVIARAGVSTAAALSNPVARGEWLHVQSPGDRGYGVGLSWAPPQPGVYGSRKDAARARVRAAREDYRERAADLEAEVRTSSAQINALSEEVSLAQQSIDTRRALLQTVSERLARGAASRIDLSLVAISLARAEQERENLELARESALIELRGLLSLPTDRSLALKANDKTKAASGASPQRAEHSDVLVRQAIAARPLLRADAARAEATNEDLSAERAKRWPWVELQGRYRKHDQATHPDDVTLGVDITLPILSLNGGPIAAAEASDEQLREVAVAHRLRVERDVRTLVAESTRRAEIAEHYSQQIAPVLAEHAKLVKLALAGLALDLTSVLTAEDMVNQGGIEYVEAKLAQRKAQIALSRAMGAFGRVVPQAVE